MKRLLIIPLLIISLMSSAATWYVSPSGNDSNPGTISQPFYSLNKAWTVVGAGDIIYMRGGTYQYTEQTLGGKSGTAGNLIKVWAYPGETPVITRSSNGSYSQPRALIYVPNGNYLHFKGLEIANLAQLDQYLWAGLWVFNSAHSIFESLNIHHNGAGAILENTDDCLILNSDFHDNSDPNTSYDPNGNADGLGMSGDYGKTNTVRGCRFWWNTDDGIDLYGVEGNVIIDNCWAWNNGYVPGTFNDGGDGNGFKLGDTFTSRPSTVLRTVTNCLSFHNKMWGFHDNGAQCNMTLYNNVSYNNGIAGTWSGGYHFNYGGAAYNIKNNISYLDVPSATDLGIVSNVSNNSWNGGVSVSGADFLSVSSTGVDGPRQSDGSLPNLNFLKLANGSDLIDAGVNVGIKYGGNGPDLGAYETQLASAPAPAPSIVSSAVDNAAPAVLGMTYNLSLANIVPAASTFSVMVNSTTRTVNTVAISGTKVLLTLATPVVNGDVITVAYNKPATNPIQTTSGGQAAAITAQAVANNVAAIVAAVPVYVSSVIQNATPFTLELSFNLSLANIVPSATAFSVKVNSTGRTVNTVSLTGTRIQLVLASRVIPGDVVTITYTKPSTNQIQTTSGGIAANITNQPVSNNCVNVAPTATITSPTANSTFISPASVIITASALDTDGNVNLVEFYNGSTKLGSSSAAPYSFTWNNIANGSYNLTVIATDNLNSRTTSSAVLISVNSIKPDPNKRPSVKIINPRKGTSYNNLTSIEISAVASDPDGTVSKVEFYKGTEKLVELSSSPYTFTWKDVAQGSYTITAIATDNLNDTTISSPVEFVVGAKIKYDANSDIVKLYPNPNNGHFSLEFLTPLENEKAEIVITDLAGKQVYSGPLLKEELLKQIDFSDSKAGVYVMLIKDKEILLTKKFIKN